ncbi:MAG: putative metallopeptidase [Planctomycetia bacterium]|nr:putative metallopeptidase [Planctomycetia bacterium]
MDRYSPSAGFDFTGHIRRLCHDMVARVEEFSHVDMRRVAIRYCQTRKAVSHGIQASLTPLRFEQGSLFMTRRRRRWTIQRLHDPSGTEMLYLLSFYLPRFQQLPFEEKLITVFHELWHIGPAFDGDIRRLPGRCHVHSSSKCEYDAEMKRFVDKWLSRNPPPSLHEFLRHNFRQLAQAHGGVFGTRIRTPKLIPCDEQAA